jgi:hypothetical protein
LGFEAEGAFAKAAGNDEEEVVALQALNGAGGFEQAFVGPRGAGEEDDFLFGPDAVRLAAGLAQFGAGG